MNFPVSLLTGLVLVFVLTAILAALGRMFQLWRVLPERYQNRNETDGLV